MKKNFYKSYNIFYSDNNETTNDLFDKAFKSIFSSSTSSLTPNSIEDKLRKSIITKNNEEINNLDEYYKIRRNIIYDIIPILLIIEENIKNFEELYTKMNEYYIEDAQKLYEKDKGPCTDPDKKNIYILHKKDKIKSEIKNIIICKNKIIDNINKLIYFLVNYKDILYLDFNTSIFPNLEMDIHQEYSNIILQLLTEITNKFFEYEREFLNDIKNEGQVQDKFTEIDNYEGYYTLINSSGINIDINTLNKYYIDEKNNKTNITNLENVIKNKITEFDKFNKNNNKNTNDLLKIDKYLEIYGLSILKSDNIDIYYCCSNKEIEILEFLLEKYKKKYEGGQLTRDKIIENKFNLTNNEENILLIKKYNAIEAYYYNLRQNGKIYTPNQIEEISNFSEVYNLQRGINEYKTKLFAFINLVSGRTINHSMNPYILLFLAAVFIICGIVLIIYVA